MEAEVEAEADNPGLASERRRRLWASNLVWELSNLGLFVDRVDLGKTTTWIVN